MKLPEPQSLWTHSSGTVYKVILIANEHTQKPDQYPVTVVYEDTSSGKVWSRPLSDWDRSMTIKN